MEAELDKTKINAIKQWLGSGSINIFGTPYAGKDTQGERLAELFNAPLLGGGEILRNSVIPPDVKETMERGGLIPTNDYIRIVLPYLSQPALNNKPLILSSVGRWHGEEEAVLGATNEAGHPIKAVIFLDLDEDDVRKRWEAAQQQQDRAGRIDDAAERIDTRLSEFKNKTLPVIDHYKQSELLITLDGRLNKDEVTKQIIDSLYEFSKTH
jgi:adenylate kinase